MSLLGDLREKLRCMNVSMKWPCSDKILCSDASMFRYQRCSGPFNALFIASSIARREATHCAWSLIVIMSPLKNPVIPFFLQVRECYICAIDLGVENNIKAYY